MYNGFVNWIYSIQKELSNVSTIITVPNRSTVSSFDRLHEHLRLKQFGSFLLNLRLLNWLRPSFNLVRNFRFIGLKILSLEFGEGQRILNRLFLKWWQILGLTNINIKFVLFWNYKNRKWFLKALLLHWYVVILSPWRWVLYWWFSFRIYFDK